MTTKDDGGPAFPALDLGEQYFGQRGAYPGMSLRDYFAALAMSAWLSTFVESRHPTDNGGAADVARASYALADAMLAARNGQ